MINAIRLASGNTINVDVKLNDLRLIIIIT
nr:MAG TPA: hypothetical protein [Caudoviricetes sp.]